ncbi:MAG: NYN domain-containing protein [Desulfobacterales bacterium]|nr:NYN domain-containing protein [Desulfobacterales bacterium]
MKTFEVAPDGSYALLIDLDNCPKQIDMLPNTLAGFSRVIACYGGMEPKVHLSLVPLLANAINDGKLEIIGMDKKGKNAADFGLAFWAGRLMAEMPADTEFLILSQDTDLDHVVNLLKSAKRKVQRVNGNTTKVKVTYSDSAPRDVASVLKGEGARLTALIEEYADSIMRPGRTRPAKKVTLYRSIKAFLKSKKGGKTDDVLKGLIDSGIVTLDGSGRVSYSGNGGAPPVQEPAYDDDIPF